MSFPIPPRISDYANKHYIGSSIYYIFTCITENITICEAYSDNTIYCTDDKMLERAWNTASVDDFKHDSIELRIYISLLSYTFNSCFICQCSFPK